MFTKGTSIQAENEAGYRNRITLSSLGIGVQTVNTRLKLSKFKLLLENIGLP